MPPPSPSLAPSLPPSPRHTSVRLLLLRSLHPNDTLWVSVFRLVWPLYVQQFVWRVLASASVFVAPLALRTLVKEVRKEGGREGSSSLMTVFYRTFLLRLLISLSLSPSFPPSLPPPQVAAYVSSTSTSSTPSSIPPSMWLAVLGLFLGPFLNAIGDTQAWALGRRMGCMSRGAVGSLVMRKVRPPSFPPSLPPSLRPSASTFSRPVAPLPGNSPICWQ